METLAGIDVSALRKDAESIRYGPARRAVRDRMAARSLAGIDLRGEIGAANRIAAPRDVWAGEMASDRLEIDRIINGGSGMRGIRGTTGRNRQLRDEVAEKYRRDFGRNLPGADAERGIGPRQVDVRDYKAGLLSGIVPDFDVAPFAGDLHMVDRGNGRRPPRVRTGDGGWAEIDRRTGRIRTWGKTGRIDDLAWAIGQAEGWDVERLRRSNDIGAAGHRSTRRQTPTQIADWWREHGYDAIATDDGVWVDAGTTRLQDVGDRVRFHGELTNEGARALILKAQEIWGGAAELTGDWSQDERDLIWAESRRSGVEIANCEPSDVALAVWEAESAVERAREATLKGVQGSAKIAQAVKDAAGGDVSALARLDPGIRAFLSSYLDDDQRKELAAADLADVIPEIDRWRKLGEDEREKTKAKGLPDPALVPAAAKPGAGPTTKAKGLQ